MKSTAAGLVDWMDQYHCDRAGSENYVCAAFQPDWKDGGRAEGYPRFGKDESNAGELSYMLLGGASTAKMSYNWTIVGGSVAMAAASAVATAALLAF